MDQTHTLVPLVLGSLLTSLACSVCSSTEIIDRVALGEWPHLRPAASSQMHSEELGQLMQRCWAEDPCERPEFNQIKVMLRKQNRSVWVSRKHKAGGWKTQVHMCSTEPFHFSIVAGFYSAFSTVSLCQLWDKVMKHTLLQCWEFFPLVDFDFHIQ